MKIRSCRFESMLDHGLSDKSVSAPTTGRLTKHGNIRVSRNHGKFRKLRKCVKTWNIQILLTNHGLVTKKVAGQFGLKSSWPLKERSGSG